MDLTMIMILALMGSGTVGTILGLVLGVLIFRAVNR